MTTITKNNVPVIADRGEKIHIGKYEEYEINGTVLRTIYPACDQTPNVTTSTPGRHVDTGATITCVLCKRLLKKKG